MEGIVAKMQVLSMEFGLKILTAILIVIIGRWVARFIQNTTGKIMTRSNVDATLVTFFRNLIYIVIIAFTILAALAQLGIQTTSFIAVIGAAGLAVGLALQGSLANFAAGILMIIFRPFQVGDFIEGAGIPGIVEEIHIFTMQLRTLDNKAIIIPNAKITSDNITNYTKKPQRRVDLVVSSVNFAVRPWVKTEDCWNVYFDTTERIKKRFDAEGISIPFPQRDAHLYQT